MTSSPILIFDIGGVLVRHDNDLLFDRLATCCADPVGAKSYLASGVYTRDIDIGRVSVKALHASLADSLGFNKPFDEFLELWSSHFSEEPGMEQFVALLAQQYRVTLFSNTNAAHIDYVSARYPALGHAHRAYYSYEMGLAKPDAEAFQKLLELEGRRPEEAIFIDDREENAAAATALGMHGVVFTDRDALIEALEALGVRAR